MERGQNCCCLTKRVLIKNDPVPLKSVLVDVRIEGYIANVRSTLCYKNVEKNPIEARYEFPMDDHSTVYHFEAQIEDRIIIAECQEKQQAKETYDDAVNAGYSAVLMQENESSSDIFSCLVGNLPPDAEAIIKFGYITELSLQPDGTLSFLLPTLLNPRYNPSVEFGGSKTPQDVTHVSKGGEQPYKFDIKATIVNPGKIASVMSPKDELNVKSNDDNTEVQVTLAKPFVPDHDLTLDVTFEELNKPHLIIEKGDDSKDGILKKDIIMLNFFPDLKDVDYTSKHEFIFVVDRSGSMQGRRMDGAKETLLLFLKSLPPGSFFNVVGFGSTFQLLFPDGSREYSEETLKAACEHQQVMRADLGGTEVLAPLKHIYDKPPMTMHNREILLLTDGDVMNTQAVIDLVKKNASNTRLFSFGIGEGASTSLVEGIARAGRGKAEFTKDGERLQPLVVKTLKEVMQLAVTGLHLDWQFEGGSVDLIQMPKDLPPLFTGERLIIYNVTSADKAVLIGKVQLKGQIGERSFEFGLDLDGTKNSSSRDETMPIHRLAAKAQIKQLQDAGKDENKTSIVLLSTAANVISCHTSMVGIDKNRKEKVAGDLMRRNVPMMSDPSLRWGRGSASGCAMPMAMQRSAVAPGRRMFSAGSGRFSARSGGFSAGSGGFSAGSGGFSAGSGGFSAGSGGFSAGSGGFSAGSGGFSAGSGGFSAGSGGFSAGSGGFSAGSGGFSAGSGLFSGETASKIARPPPPTRPPPPQELTEDMRRRLELRRRLRGSSDRIRAKEVLPQGPPKELTYMTVVELQAFSGLWKLNIDLASALQTTLDALQNASPIKALNVWATVLALSYLEVTFGDKRDEWEMVEMKARQWLDLQDREGLSIDDLLQKAKAVVGQL